jgi:hypothetical protein
VFVFLAFAACTDRAPNTGETESALTTCVELPAGGDATIALHPPNKALGDKKVLHVGDGDEALIRFDLGQLPANAAITSATMKLYVSDAEANQPIGIHRVKSSWQESTVTYQSFAQQFATKPIGSLVVAGDNVQKSVDLTDQVRSWRSGAETNEGVLLEGNAAKATLVSREGGQQAQRPKLQVCYAMAVDHCAGNPCEHAGSCTNTTSGFTCACAAGYTGPTCAIDIDDCAAHPCQNGGSCSDGVAGYTCACASGFSGTNCETDIDECAAAPCQHGGVCTDRIGGYTCACPAGYTGMSCETMIDSCAVNPCQHGSCANVPGGFTCTCSTGYTGATCEIDIDDCAANVCHNGGTCVDDIGSFSCVCPPDWGGPTCDINLNACSQHPCLNGATCTNGAGNYTCTCAAGFSGTNCEVDINDCAGNQCANGSTCVDGVAGYTCACPAGYTGAICELPPPPPPVRINGVCTAICVATPGDGWGWENNASCVTPTNPLASSSPFCDSPLPQQAYEAPNAIVTDSTTSVATIPRPPHITVDPPHACPYSAPGLVAFDPAWLAADGTLMVPPNTKVLVHGNTDLPADRLIKYLYVPSTSELVFADEPTSIRITDLYVDGALRMGSATCRLESAFHVEWDTDEDVSSPAVRQTIYNRMGLGLMVGPNGVLDLFGHLYQPTWTRLHATAAAGASQLSLAEPVDWRPGQRIVIATSARVDYPYADENEVRTIVAAAGTTVTLDQPLAYSHYGGPEYQVEVGLLSRNLEFHTSPRVVAAAPTFGGHIMVHSKLAHVSGVELYRMGQQNFLARYPFHWHRSGDVGNASFFTDSSVWRSNWRCAVVHRTDRAIVSRNVAYDNFGHCYYLEDGLEMNNEVSFNLSVRPKIMGPTDDASLQQMRDGGQPGFTLAQSADLAQPADRAAAGFYITNGNNKIIGNASSGGFTGYSFPNLPRAIGGSPERIFPILYGAMYFDGNTAHTAGYLWSEGGACIYVGGTLVEIAGQLQYTSGRTTEWELLRHQTEVFNNTKTFLCEAGIVHWGNNARIVNFESWDNGLLARLFGSASIQSTLVVGGSANVLPSLPAHDGSVGDLNHPLSWWHRGFQFYDTRTQTILHDVVFRDFHHGADAFPLKEQDNCALLSMTHSDQYTPQHMNAVAGLHFVNVDGSQRLCISARGTLSSRNFNLIDVDGSLSGTPGLVASEWATGWRLSSECHDRDDWGAAICPLHGTQNVASIGTIPNANVHVTMYGLDNTTIGENWYSSNEYVDAQISGPSGIGWHHTFPGGIPPEISVQTLQVPDGSFVVLSFTLPPGIACAIHDPAWTAAPDVDALLASTAPAYTTSHDTCFVRIPPTSVGDFVASGLAVPNMTWRGNPTPTTYFTIDTGCSPSNPACQTVVSAVPVLP